MPYGPDLLDQHRSAVDHNRPQVTCAGRDQIAMEHRVRF
jgi:hypothetical protein